MVELTSTGKLALMYDCSCHSVNKHNPLLICHKFMRKLFQKQVCHNVDKVIAPCTTLYGACAYVCNKEH